MIIVYGIANCSSVKKAREYLSQKGLNYEFYDFKKTPPQDNDLQTWFEQLGRDIIINKKGTTWRNLTDDEKNSVIDNQSAKALIDKNPSIIKRPIIKWEDGKITAGFNVDDYPA